MINGQQSKIELSTERKSIEITLKVSPKKKFVPVKIRSDSDYFRLCGSRYGIPTVSNVE